jgi:hypothetical protein
VMTAKSTTPPRREMTTKTLTTGRTDRAKGRHNGSEDTISKMEDGTGVRKRGRTP